MWRKKIVFNSDKESAIAHAVRIARRYVREDISLRAYKESYMIRIIASRIQKDLMSANFARNILDTVECQQIVMDEIRLAKSEEPEGFW